MKHMKLLSLLLALTMVLGLLAGCGAESTAPAESEDVAVTESADAAVTESQPAEGVVHSTLTVTYADGTAKDFALESKEGETLVQAMLAAGLVSEEEAASGFVTVIDGQEAKWEPDMAFWALLDAEGNMTEVGAGDIVLTEGDAYSFTYTVSE